MRDIDSFIQTSFDQSDEEVIMLESMPEFDIEDFDLNDEKEIRKYIDCIKRTVRNSYEYRKLIAFLRDNWNMNVCSFYENVTNVDTYKIKIEIHHEPFTLEDICLIVFNKRCAYQESLYTELVAKEVMFLHYKLLIGLVPVALTVHKLVHNNYWFVPLDKVAGRYDTFRRMYEPYMTAEMLDSYDRLVKASATTLNNADILKQKFIYVDVADPAQRERPLEEIVELLNNRVTEIKQGSPLVNNIESPIEEKLRDIVKINGEILR